MRRIPDASADSRTSAMGPETVELIRQGQLMSVAYRGWVNYFVGGHASRCFSYVRDWVEKKIRCHLARASQRQGFGWKRRSPEWLYETVGLLHEYRVGYQPRSWAAPTR